jgi:hypothetical protein
VSAQPTTWAAALDEFEEALARYEAALALAGDVDPPPPFTPPPVEGALPAALRGRANDLLARADELTARLRAEQERIRRHLARLPRRRGPEAPPVAGFEARA